MAGRGHNRGDSAQSESAPSMPHGRGMTPAGRGNRHPGGYQQNFQNQPYGGYGGRGGYQGGNQPRNGPANMNPNPYPTQQQYPSPRAVPRSPALSHVSAHHSPSLPPAVPATHTPQLYPPQPHGQQQQQFIPQGTPQYPVPQMYQDPAAYGYQYPMQYQYANTSPRPPYVNPNMVGAYPPYVQQGAPPMSRSSSANVDLHRPPSSIGQHGQPPLTPQQQQHMIVSPPPPGTPGPQPYARTPVKKAPSKAIEIKKPDGTALKIEKPVAPVPPAAPIIVSSPSPAPGRASSRHETPHSRSTSRSNKTAEEKRAEMREKVAQEAQKALEEHKKEEAQKAAAAEQDKIRKEEEAERLRKEEEEAKAKAEAEAKAKAEEAERAKIEAEKKAKAEEKAKAEAEAKAAAEKAAKEAEEKASKEAEKKAAKEAEEKAAKEAEEAKAKAEAQAAVAAAAAVTEAEAAKIVESAVDHAPETAPPETPKAENTDSESMPPPSLKSMDKGRSKPSPLNLQIKTTEPALPSAQLTALRSARPLENLKSLAYPEGIQSPNPALNPMANATKFKYDKEFLMQFQNVFTEKPSLDWDQRMKETVGDTESARPSTARTPSGMGPRSSSSRGASGMSAFGGGAMGSFVGSSGVGSKPAISSSAERFKASNPLAMMGSLTSRPGLVRTGSSTSLPGASNALPSSPRTSNRSARGSSKRGNAGGAPSMERTESRGPAASQPTISLADVKPLPVSANRWTPRSLKAATPESAPAAASSGPELMSPELVQRKVKAALNKMTPEKFDKISDQILEITAQSKHESDGRTLRQVIQLTFEKACDEAHWASMYAKFCKRMLETMDPEIKDETVKDKHGVLVTGGNLFRKYLLNRCQEEFERGWKVNMPPKPEGVSDEVLMLSDEYYIAAAAKRRGLGLVQFIGELFKLNMLTERIMNECVRKLLDFEGIPEDETVESLAKLLRTIGAQLDTSDKSKPFMDKYFTRIQGLVDNKELNSRMKFMLMDVIDLRKGGWETKETEKGPKTIQEVREEALKAQQEKEAASRASRSRPQTGRGDARSFASNNFGGMGGQSYHDNKTAGTVNADDLKRLGNLGSRSRQTSSGPQSFGPNSLLGPRGSGSRRGLGPGMSRDGTATPPVPASTSSPNPFSALQEASHNDGYEATSPPPSNANSPQVSNAKPVTDEA